MKYVLTCDCGNTDFTYDEKCEKFTCRECGIEYEHKEAGFELLGDADE